MTKDEALNARQLAALRLLSGRDQTRKAALTGPQIAGALWGYFTSFEQGYRTCKQLEARGLVDAIGYGMDNARTWGATEAGREFIAAREAQQ